MFDAPYSTELKPYGRALVDLARERTDIVCITGDLTRQCEIDLFQAALPERFIHAGMAEANMMSMAAGLARRGLQPFVHTFGVFATRRPYDQLVNAIAYPNLPVRIIGFMPGLSTPGGPSHQSIDDVAIMRAMPNMTVIDVADATETRKLLPEIAELPGPVYVRLKRGEIPVIFGDDHRFSLSSVQRVIEGDDAVIFASGMMLSAAVQAAHALRDAGVPTRVVNVPVIKPLDRDGVASAARGARFVVTAENHSIIGGLGSAVAEVLAEEGGAAPLRRVGVQDTFAEGSKSAPYLFEKYGLTTQAVIDAVWTGLGRTDAAPTAEAPASAEGEYAPV